jgi:hypothetical protein
MAFHNLNIKLFAPLPVAVFPRFFGVATDRTQRHLELDLALL